ncbi:MAG: SUMF1/EgtB/PvdO family nonheme iron enzyme, partial [Deltaproteobacteria bacterium]
LYDLQGNVMEWTADWYAPYDQAKLQNPKGPEAPPNPTYPQKVARGGAWQGLFGRATEAGLRSSRRYGLAAWTQAFNLGFRCAADAL